MAGHAWNVLWTRSHCERQVCDHLASRGFETFLPMAPVWPRRDGRRRDTPLFPGYLFLRCAADRESRLEVRKARGLVAVLGESWDRPATVPEEEIESIRSLVSSGLPFAPHAYLREGRRVRIVRGALRDLEGILIGNRERKGLLLVSVHLLRRSVAVEVESDAVEPVAEGPSRLDPRARPWDRGGAARLDLAV